MNRADAFALMAAVENPPLWRARLATIAYRTGPGNVERTTSRQRRAGSRRTKRLAGRRR